MKSISTIARKLGLGIALLVLAGLVSSAAPGAPLSKDDVSLLLLASSPSSKIIQVVQQRGVDFQMNPDLAKKFHDQGASDELIDALRAAGQKAATAKASAPAPAAAPSTPPAESDNGPDTKPNAPGEPAPRARETPPSRPTASAPSPDEPVLHTRSSSDEGPGPQEIATDPSATRKAQPAGPAQQAAGKSAPPAIPASASAPGLKDPSPQEIQHIIQEFAAKEKIFRAARNNYTYHQINKVQEMGQDNEIVGSFEQEWDILYDDAGKRIERVTYAPVSNLKNLIITKEDIEGFRSITPFVLTTDELPDYDIKYLGHVKVDEITAYVFSTRPKTIQKDRQYFQGVVWVDDRDFQIVKSEGKQVPQNKVKHGQENLFPRFTTWREQVDGKFWFPTYTMGDDTLYFSNGPPVHMKEIIRYTDYKQFKSGVRILTVESIDKKDETTPQAPPKK